MEEPTVLTNEIKWDLRYLKLAREVSTWSKDPSTKTGAVILSKDFHEFLGYNGFPTRMPDSPELYAEREEKYSRIIHCEMNALIKAGNAAQGSTLYTWPFLSCDRCAAHMVQAGITRVVAPQLPEHLKDRWSDNLAKSRKYFEEAGIEVVEYLIDFTIEGWELDG